MEGNQRLVFGGASSVWCNSPSFFPQLLQIIPAIIPHKFSYFSYRCLNLISSVFGGALARLYNNRSAYEIKVFLVFHPLSDLLREDTNRKTQYRHGIHENITWHITLSHMSFSWMQGRLT